MEKKIIIISGEPSGDLQAGLLAARLKALEPTVRILAVGGEHLRRAGAEIFHEMKDLSVLGFFEALKKLKVFKGLMRLVLHKVQEVKPDAIIFVDFSGFNLRLAKKINKRVKTIYYISPQVWASRPGRIKTIKKYIDMLIVIFKFEQDFYRKFGIQAEFVGHPLLDIAKPTLAREEALKEFGLRENSPVFALLPGSRVSEIKPILPIMLESAQFLREKITGAQFIISKMRNIDDAVYARIIHKTGIDAKIIEGKQYDCLNIADFVLVASGTATLETAIMQKPNVVIYKMGLLNYLLYRPQVVIPFIGMENIVAGSLIAPEFIQCKARPKLIADTILEILQDKNWLLQIRSDLSQLKEKLGPPQAPLRAAQSILAFINSRKSG